MKPRALASSHTGRRGQDVRQASSTSAYGLGRWPIHSSRSRIKGSTVSGMTTSVADSVSSLDSRYYPSARPIRIFCTSLVPS
jgi:hypothetical protein